MWSGGRRREEGEAFGGGVVVEGRAVKRVGGGGEGYGWPDLQRAIIIVSPESFAL